MGTTKTEAFDPERTFKADLFKALGHPARIRIIEHLLHYNGCSCGEIVPKLPLAQPTVSQHLKVLKDVGILQINTINKSKCYCLDYLKLNSMKEIINEWLSNIDEYDYQITKQ